MPKNSLVSIKFSTVCKLTSLAGLAGIGLAHSYYLLQQLGIAVWASAAIIHTLLSLIIWFFFVRKARELFFPPPLALVQGKPYLSYLPSAAVLVFALLIASTTTPNFFDNASIGELPLAQWAGVLWVPIVEETVFRLGLSNYFKKLAANRFWGIYFSALTFSWLHSVPTIYRLMQGETGIYLGPFLLAVCCEVLYLFSGRLLPSILFHAACNATVIIFSLAGPKGFDWFGYLYL